MVSNKGYTTAQKVRDVLAGQVITYITNAMIDNMINRIEGIIDSNLKVGGGTGSGALTWDTTKVPHWVVEGAATYGAALQCAGPSAASWNTLEQLVNAQNLFSYLYKIHMDIIQAEGYGDFVVEQ